VDVSEQEREEIINLIRQGRPLPARYRASLFEDALETELIWPGKTTDVERTVLPFQSIEHIDEPRSETVVRPTLFSMDEGSGRQTGGWSNKLVWGDNKLILSSLVNGPMRQQIDDAGGLKLIYIDPPFDVGSDFSLELEVGDHSITKSASVVEMFAYRDTWGRGRESFASMLFERLKLAHALLSIDGAIYVQCDWRVSGVVRMLLDEVFGSERLLNEITWGYRIQGVGKSTWARKHDTIFYYSKSSVYTFHPQKEDVIYDKPFIDTKRHESEIKNLSSKKIEEIIARIRSRQSLQPALKNQLFDTYYNDVYIRDVWDCDSTKPLISGSSEYLNYPTQKPKGLLKRIIEASSDPGDLVADFFCGSGTTLEVAERLDRKWIGADLGRFAIHTSRKRLISVQREQAKENRSYRAFEILNLGSYERQYFAGIDMSLPAEQRAAASIQKREQFLELILSAYGGKRSEQLPGFDGVKDNSCVFVGPLDAPVTEDDVRKAIANALKHGVTRVDVLGFEFEMGIKPAMSDEAKELGITMTLRYIPNDVFEKRAIFKGQVKFFDVGYLEIKPKQDKSGAVTVELSEFGVFYAQEDADATAAGLKNGGAKIVIDSGQVVRVSKDKKGIARKEILTKSWADWIDYWAVDFDFTSQKEVIAVTSNEGITSIWTGRYIFENQWQDFRTKSDRKIRLTSAPHTYKVPGEYKIAVKVVDVFGNDTTKVVKFKVK